MKNSHILPIIVMGLVLSSNVFAKEHRKSFLIKNVHGTLVAPVLRIKSHDGTTIEGIASWYGYESVPGNKHHRPKTASGQLFNPNQLTAAHKKLPFGTKVKVTNLKNNRSVVVVINDRGPYIRNRIIDLSKFAAKSIGIEGIQKVSLTILTDSKTNT